MQDDGQNNSYRIKKAQESKYSNGTMQSVTGS